jgi:2-oxoglutarate-Fe(II)-dependent dioxygenase family protein
MKFEVEESDFYDEKEFVGKKVGPFDWDQTIGGPCDIYREGKLILSVREFNAMDPNLRAARLAAKQLLYPKSTRTSGLETQSRIFGFSPRVAIRNDFCSKTSMATDFPEAHEVFRKTGELIAPYYAGSFPEVYEANKVEMETVLPEWRFTELFTGGIVNKNNALAYHYDSGNFKNVLSCMLLFKESVRGGELVFPKWRIALDLPNASLTMFDGQAILHGVSPIQRLNRNAYRYTIVFYALRAMRECLPYDEELRRARLVKTKNKGGENERTV